MKFKFSFLPLVLIGLLSGLSRAESALLLPDGHLDMPALRKAYIESEFTSVRTTLESFMKAHKTDATRDEKVFLHIYLGVIYAADSLSSAKAESHFNALLELRPNIELVDMFVPPQIQNMFDRVKHDYLRMKEYNKHYDALGHPLSDSASAPPKPGPKTATTPAVQDSGSGNAWMWWTLGGVAAIGAGAGVYFLTSNSPAPRTSHTTVTGP